MTRDVPLPTNTITALPACINLDANGWFCAYSRSIEIGSHAVTAFEQSLQPPHAPAYSVYPRPGSATGNEQPSYRRRVSDEHRYASLLELQEMSLLAARAARGLFKNPLYSRNDSRRWTASASVR